MVGKGRWRFMKTPGVISWYVGRGRTQALKPPEPPPPRAPLPKCGLGSAPASGASQRLGQRQGLEESLVGSVPSYPEGKGGGETLTKEGDLDFTKEQPSPPRPPRFPTEGSPRLFIRLDGTHMAAPPPRSKTKSTKRRSKPPSTQTLHRFPNANVAGEERLHMSRRKLGCPFPWR